MGPFVQKAHENVRGDFRSSDLMLKRLSSQGVKASVSIGGWTGSLFYSSNVGSEQNRTAFIQAIEGLVNKYNLTLLISSTLELRGTSVGADYSLLAGSTPGKQGIAATRYHRMTPPTSSHSSRN